MPRYALVDQVNNVLRQEIRAAQPPDLPHKGWRWLPVAVTDPVFDAEIQVREGPVTTVNAGSVSVVWTVRSKTPAEIDADKTAEVNALRRVAFNAAFDHENRIRMLEGQPQVTQGQFRNALKGLL